jgi:hypothetical protein
MYFVLHECVRSWPASQYNSGCLQRHTDYAADTCSINSCTGELCFISSHSDPYDLCSISGKNRNISLFPNVKKDSRPIHPAVH